MEAPEQIIRSSLTDAVLVLWREDNDGKCSFCLQVVDTHITVHDTHDNRFPSAAGHSSCANSLQPNKIHSNATKHYKLLTKTYRILNLF